MAHVRRMGKHYTIDKESNALVFGEAVSLDEIFEFYTKWSLQIHDGCAVISKRHVDQLHKLYDLAQNNQEFFENPLAGTQHLDNIIAKLEKLIEEFNARS